MKIRSIPSGVLYAFEIPAPQEIHVKKPTIPNGNLNTIINTKNKVENAKPKSQLPSSLHESHKTSVSNLNALYDEANDKKDEPKDRKGSTTSQDKYPGKSVRVIENDDKTLANGM